MVYIVKDKCVQIVAVLLNGSVLYKKSVNLKKILNKTGKKLVNKLTRVTKRLYSKNMSETSVLIVEDKDANRKMLAAILGEYYNTIEASNGKEALAILRRPGINIGAIILDLIMPEMDGYAFLDEYKDSIDLRHIPVIVSTSDTSEDSEARCLAAGAWDFIKKPYNPSVIRFRVKNVIERSELYSLRELRRREMYDGLTGLYKKDVFMQKTAEMLRLNPNRDFDMIQVDINRFQAVNNAFGTTEGDHLLQYMGRLVEDLGNDGEPMTCCRENADFFYICRPRSEEADLEYYADYFHSMLSRFKNEIDIVPNMGVYRIVDSSMDVSEMMDCAHLAAKECKGNYVKNYAIYASYLRENIIKEQLYVSNMAGAVENEEFVIYYQPKVDLADGSLVGAEALVRWLDPEKGLIPPGEFIPVFERNGLIIRLDYYVWEHVCMQLRAWLDEGKQPLPVSINISRISTYNPFIVEQIDGLVQKYELPRELLELELTESAYSLNPVAVREYMKRFRALGFTVLMDDFGSGYSSLNVLKDIEVDILKIDMRFLDSCDDPKRAENIMASVIRMAKWLRMPVIAEGVERKEQVYFLRSVGCEYIQGYYFSKPLPLKEYEMMAFSEEHPRVASSAQMRGESREDDRSGFEKLHTLINTALHPAAMYEYETGRIELIRVNDAYYDIFGFHNVKDYQQDLCIGIAEEHREAVLAAFDTAIDTGSVGACEYKRIIPRKKDGESDKEIWISLRVRHLDWVGEKALMFGVLEDITERVALGEELKNYRKQRVEELEKKKETE